MLWVITYVGIRIPEDDASRTLISRSWIVKNNSFKFKFLTTINSIILIVKWTCGRLQLTTVWVHPLVEMTFSPVTYNRKMRSAGKIGSQSTYRYKKTCPCSKSSTCFGSLQLLQLSLLQHRTIFLYWNNSSVQARECARYKYFIIRFRCYSREKSIIDMIIERLSE